ncbi:hypothetical protein E5Q_03298 [Mixia osmundae IAM 14324]|uniref:Conserved oligomeric Golgi complex subunit 4 n=1 Tax=Mixia osmundae (strain CBS 9802 / IAM 14324 / JCM 22182 / KY 12970) TaxID=764103 RepID=G7E1B8_MIXOS|nr:hypothetical protein E5Q_03298 [Mixia osmundae IAM 14324]
MDALPPLEDLDSLEDILADLERTETLEASLDESLSAHLSSPLLDNVLVQLEQLVPDVQGLEMAGLELARSVEGTAAVAERISGKVRTLDLVQSRLRESIEMVQSVQELKTAILSISVSIGRLDWETATRHLQRAMQVDPAITTSAFAESSVPTADLPMPPSQALSDYRQSLLETFLKEFEAACQERDEANTSRYFKLFPVIRAEKEGLDAYSKFICSIVHGRSKAALTQKANSLLYFSQILTPLFEQIALIVSQHQPVVEKYYGDGKMIDVVARLQTECDLQALSVLERWHEERAISKKLSESRAYRFQQLQALSQPAIVPRKTGFNAPFNTAPFRQMTNSPALTASQSAQDDDSLDPRTIDALLSEVAQISNRWQLYRKFIYSRLVHSKIPMDEDSVRQSDTLLESLAFTVSTDALIDLIEKSAFNEQLSLHLGQVYVPFETWYFRTSVEKAHTLDEADLGSQPVLSSSLDDTFYILKKVIGRALSMGSATALAAIAKSMRNILDNDFAEILARRTENQLSLVPPYSTGYRPRDEERDKRERDAQIQAIVYLNDLDQAGEYLGRIIDEMLERQGPESLQQSFFVVSEFEQASDALLSIKSTDERFRATAKSGLESLFGSLVRPRLRPMIVDCLKDMSYQLDEDSYGEAETQDLVRKRFIRHWTDLTALYKEYLTENNYLTLFSMAVNVLGRSWEGLVRNSRFTELGALRFDADLRSIISFLSSQTPLGTGALRDSFARMQQIATLLCLESADDADDLRESSGWKLSPAEMKTVQSLRV